MGLAIRGDLVGRFRGSTTYVCRIHQQTDDDDGLPCSVLRCELRTGAVNRASDLSKFKNKQMCLMFSYDTQSVVRALPWTVVAHSRGSMTADAG